LRGWHLRHSLRESDQSYSADILQTLKKKVTWILITWWKGKGLWRPSIFLLPSWPSTHCQHLYLGRHMPMAPDLWTRGMMKELRQYSLDQRFGGQNALRVQWLQGTTVRPSWKGSPPDQASEPRVRTLQVIHERRRSIAQKKVARSDSIIGGYWGRLRWNWKNQERSPPW